MIQSLGRIIDNNYFIGNDLLESIRNKALSWNLLAIDSKITSDSESIFKNERKMSEYSSILFKKSECSENFLEMKK